MSQGESTMKLSLITRRLALAGAVLVLGACGSLLEVTNPGPIEDSRLDTPSAMPGLVTGMSFQLSTALSLVSRYSTLWSDELTHSGTLGAETIFSGGVIPAEDV